MKVLNPVTDIRLAQGCATRWEDLNNCGPEPRIRRCPECGVRVYRVEGLTPEQTVTLISAHEPVTPNMLYVRTDGCLAVQDRRCFRRRRRRFLPRLSAALTGLFSFVA